MAVFNLTYLSLIITFIDLFGSKILTSQFIQNLIRPKSVRRKRLVPLARKKKQQQSKIKEILSNENLNEFVDLALHIANYSTDIMYLNQVEYRTWLAANSYSYYIYFGTDAPDHNTSSVGRLFDY